MQANWRLLVPIAAGVVFGAAMMAWRATDTPSPEPAISEQPQAKATKGDRPRNRRRLDNRAADPTDAAAAIIPPTPIAEGKPAAHTERAPSTPPNVVLVLGCTVRKDQLTPYGGHEEATPFLQQLADRGTTFDDTIAAAPWTRAASTAILTGRHPVSIGMVEPSAKRNNRRLPESAMLLGEHMSERGYFTLGATGNPNLIAEFGFAQGHEVYQPNIDPSWSRKLSGRALADVLVDALRDNRAGGDTRPFFLRVMMLDAHSPRMAGEEKFGSYRDDGLPDRIAQYRYHLHQFDEGVEHLHERLVSMGYDSSNTVFMVIADHGEGMNYPAHHGFAHGQYHTSSTNHVPWIVAGPGVAKGHRILGVSSQVDLVPTLLGVIGEPLEAEHPTDGVDLSALVRGEGHQTPHEVVWSDTWFGESSRAAMFSHSTQCQDDFGSTARQKAKGKFVPGCYDRHEDPLFTKAIDDPERMASLHTWRTARQRELKGATVDQVAVEADLNRQLEMLGYHE